MSFGYCCELVLLAIKTKLQTLHFKQKQLPVTTNNTSSRTSRQPGVVSAAAPPCTHARKNTAARTLLHACEEQCFSCLGKYRAFGQDMSFITLIDKKKRKYTVQARKCHVPYLQDLSTFKYNLFFCSFFLHLR